MVPHVNQTEGFSAHLAFENVIFLIEHNLHTLQRVLQQSAMLSLILQFVGSAGCNFNLDEALTSAASLPFEAFEEAVTFVEALVDLPAAMAST